MAGRKQGRVEDPSGLPDVEKSKQKTKSARALKKSPSSAGYRKSSSSALATATASETTISRRTIGNVGILAMFGLFFGWTIFDVHKSLLQSSLLDESAVGIIDVPESVETASGEVGTAQTSAPNPIGATANANVPELGSNVLKEAAMQSGLDARSLNADAGQQEAVVTTISTPVAAASDSSGKIYAPFEHHEGVVVVTKIQSDLHWAAIKQSFCLFHYAYNNRPLYDIVVFSSEPISEDKVQEVQAMVHPAKFSVVIDNPGLHEMVRAYPPAIREETLSRCNVTTVEEMNWYLRCSERIFHERLAYCWQAEFRTKHIWNHPSIAQYKTLFWMDSDVFATRVWKQDPIAIMLQNDLKLFFLNFPAGRTRGHEIPMRAKKAFGRRICSVTLVDGHLALGSDTSCSMGRLAQVHGFFHITDLDFYRSERVQNWFNILIGDNPLHREFDDQIAVTLPAAMYEPEKSWFMESHGVILEAFHNCKLDGRRPPGVPGFRKWWSRYGKGNFSEAHGKCPITNSD